MISGASLRDAEFRWKDAYHLKGDPQACGERYVELSENIGHAAGREDVYKDAARSKTSPFRLDVFADDDGKAARNWRLEMAGRIIRAIEMVSVRDATPQEEKIGITTVDVSVPLSMNIPGIGQRMFHDVMTDVDLRVQALASIVAGLEQWQAKVERFKSLSRDFAKLVVKAKKLLGKEESAASKKRKRK